MTVIILIIKQFGFFSAEISLQDADQLAHSVDPDQTAPSGAV